MKLNCLTAAAAGAALMIFAVPAFAADVAPAPAPSKNNSISIEFSPEWSTAASTYGQWADDYIKLGYSHTFDNNIVWGAAFQYTWRPDPKGTADQAETSIGYKFKAGAFTLTPCASCWVMALVTSRASIRTTTMLMNCTTQWLWPAT